MDTDEASEGNFEGDSRSQPASFMPDGAVSFGREQHAQDSETPFGEIQSPETTSSSKVTTGQGQFSLKEGQSTDQEKSAYLTETGASTSAFVPEAAALFSSNPPKEFIPDLAPPLTEDRVQIYGEGPSDRAEGRAPMPISHGQSEKDDLRDLIEPFSIGADTGGSIVQGQKAVVPKIAHDPVLDQLIKSGILDNVTEIINWNVVNFGTQTIVLI